VTYIALTTFVLEFFSLGWYGVIVLASK